MAAQTINDVILQLEKLIEDSIEGNSRLGFFAALYHKVTTQVREGIQKGEFEDGLRM